MEVPNSDGRNSPDNDEGGVAFVATGSGSNGEQGSLEDKQVSLVYDNDDKRGDPKKQKSKNSNIRTEAKDGKELFICVVCEYESEQIRNVKSHITKKHREKPTLDDSVVAVKKMNHGGDDIKDLDESLFRKWNNSEFVTSTQINPDEL